jgi:hypothetical protein
VRLSALFGAVVLCVASSPFPAGGNAYSFVKIAETGSGGVVNFPWTPSLNNSGAVALVVDNNLSTNRLVVGSGGPLQTIYDRSGPLNALGGQVTINDSGAIAFVAAFDSGLGGIVRGNGGALTTIADNSGNSFGSFGVDHVNALGAVSFWSGLKTGGSGFYLGDGSSTPSTIASTSTPAFMFKTFATGGSYVNDNGDVVFQAQLNNNSLGVFLKRGSTITDVADDSGPLIFFSSGPSINNNGLMLFSAQFDTGGTALFSYLNGQLTTIADTNTSSFANFNDPIVNASGAFAFLGLLDNGTSGIWAGTDPLNDLVIATGMPLFGSTVSNLHFYRGLNDFGQMAFEADLADGRHVIARADPVPEPSVLGLMVAAAALLRRQWA